MAVQKSMILDHMGHASPAAHVFIGKGTSSERKNALICSDGVGSQYKNYKNFANLCHHVRLSTCC